MAKAHTIKPKSSIAEWLKRITAPKPKPATRPAAAQASTLTNIPAAGATATRSGAQGAKAAAAGKKPAKAAEPGWSLARFRLPFIGGKPFLTQMQMLGTLAVLLLVATALMVFLDTTQRTRNATYISIASQMQYHTQRLAKAAGLAARGQPAAFPQVEDSRPQFADYLGVL